MQQEAERPPIAANADNLDDLVTETQPDMLKVDAWLMHLQILASQISEELRHAPPNALTQVELQSIGRVADAIQCATSERRKHIRETVTQQLETRKAQHAEKAIA